MVEIRKIITMREVILSELGVAAPRPVVRAVDAVKMRPPPDSTFRTFAQKTGWPGSVDAVLRKSRFGDGRGITLGGAAV